MLGLTPSSEKWLLETNVIQKWKFIIQDNGDFMS